MWTRGRLNSGLTLYEALLTAFILFLILASVSTLLQSSLRALKSQQGRELSEVVQVAQMIRRDLADAVSLTPGEARLDLQRGDPDISWEEMRSLPQRPDSLPAVEVRYQLVEDRLQRSQAGGPAETLLTGLTRFASERQDYSVGVRLSLRIGERERSLVWSFWSPAL
jgi:hypothetical protein